MQYPTAHHLGRPALGSGGPLYRGRPYADTAIVSGCRSSARSPEDRRSRVAVMRQPGPTRRCPGLPEWFSSTTHTGPDCSTAAGWSRIETDPRTMSPPRPRPTPDRSASGPGDRSEFDGLCHPAAHPGDFSCCRLDRPAMRASPKPRKSDVGGGARARSRVVRFPRSDVAPGWTVDDEQSPQHPLRRRRPNSVVTPVSAVPTAYVGEHCRLAPPGACPRGRRNSGGPGGDFPRSGRDRPSRSSSCARQCPSIPASQAVSGEGTPPRIDHSMSIRRVDISIVFLVGLC